MIENIYINIYIYILMIENIYRSKFIFPNFLVLSFYLFFHYINFPLLNLIENIFNTLDSPHLHGHLIYLPHGVRVITFLVFGTKILPGIFIAQTIAGVDFINFANNDYLLTIVTSLASLPCVLFAVLLMHRKFQVSYDKLSLQNIMLIVLLSSLLNSFLSYCTRIIFEYNFNQPLTYFFPTELFQFLIGDIIGSLIIIFLLTIYPRIRIKP
mgnify:CR=1 FL=1